MVLLSSIRFGMKKAGKLLILFDAIINYLLGLILLLYSDTIVQIFGLPATNNAFYPTILGAVLFGIGIALSIEYLRKGALVGLGLGGAISINIMGGIVLFIWLISGSLSIPVHGKVLLWVLDAILLVISLFEGLAFWKSKQLTK
jgi:hypothetical protein